MRLTLTVRRLRAPLLLMLSSLAACRAKARSQDHASAPAVVHRPEIAPLDLGPVPMLSAADAKLANSLAGAPLASLGNTFKGVPEAEFRRHDIPPSVLVYLARTSTDPRIVIAALSTSTGSFIKSDFPLWPPSAKELLLGLLTSPDARVAAAAAGAAWGQFTDDADVERMILRLCAEHPSAVVRGAACESAGGRQSTSIDTPTVQTLFAALSDPSPTVILKAAHALAFDQTRIRASQIPLDALSRLTHLATHSMPTIRDLAFLIGEFIVLGVST